MNANDNRRGQQRYFFLQTEKAEHYVMIYLRKFFDEPIKNYIKTFENIQNISSGQRDD